MVQQNRMPGAVIIGGDFRALGVVRSLGRQGIPCVIIADAYRAAWFSRYVVRRFRWLDPINSNRFLEFLLSIGKEQQLKNWLLIPSTDDAVELIARNSLQIAQVYRPVTPPWDIVRWANDKRLTYKMARALSIPFPKTWYPSGEADFAAMEITFPVIVKPVNSVRLHRALRLKALPANDYEELLAQYRRVTKIIDPCEILIQEMIPGDGRTQFSVGTFCKEGEMLFSMTARRTRQYPIDYGLNSCFVEAIEVPELFAPTESLLRYMCVSGMVEVEFKYDARDKQYKLLDINVRPWGWHTLCQACGLDFPYIQYCDLWGQETARVAPNYGRRWVRLIVDIPAGLQEIRAGLTTPAAYLHSLTGSISLAVFAWGDPLPAIGDFLAISLSQLIKASVRERTYEQ